MTTSLSMTRERCVKLLITPDIRLRALKPRCTHIKAITIMTAASDRSTPEAFCGSESLSLSSSTKGLLRFIGADSPGQPSKKRARPEAELSPAGDLEEERKGPKAVLLMTLALQTVGIDYTLEPEMQSLETVLKARLQSLPGEVKEAVENLLAPAKEEPKDVTTKLKVTVGELRQLSNKKAGLQKKVDDAKDQYKLLLDELKMVQELIDKEQQQLMAQSEAYAELLKEEMKDECAEELPEVDADVNDHVLKALAQVGILRTDSQKTDLEQRLAENMLKRRKKAEGPVRVTLDVR